MDAERSGNCDAVLRQRHHRCRTPKDLARAIREKYSSWKSKSSRAANPITTTSLAPNKPKSEQPELPCHAFTSLPIALPIFPIPPCPNGWALPSCRRLYSLTGRRIAKASIFRRKNSSAAAALRDAADAAPARRRYLPRTICRKIPAEQADSVDPHLQQDERDRRTRPAGRR